VPLAAYIARIDPVFRQGPGTVGIPGQQQMSIVVKVPDDRHRDSNAVQLLHDGRYCRGGRLIVDGDSYQLAPSTRQLGHLARGRHHIGGVGVGHRLDHDRMVRSNRYTADQGADSTAACG
jgi:hypothetical protein